MSCLGTARTSLLIPVGTANYGKDCTEHVLTALETGYRYLDGAQQYANSESIRDAFQAWGGKREDVYILTKCGCAYCGIAC